MIVGGISIAGVLMFVLLIIALLALRRGVRWIVHSVDCSVKARRDLAMAFSDLNDRLGRIEGKLDHLSQK